jgi:hypothetical protein
MSRREVMRTLRASLAGMVILWLLVGPTGAVVAQEEPTDPGPAAYVHGRVTLGDCCGDEVATYDEDGDRLTLRGMVASGTVVMDDPRMSGAWEKTVRIDEFPQPDTDERVEVHWGELTITNDRGGWSGTWTSTYDSQPLSNEIELALHELTGTGAYEGLSALLAPTGRGRVAGAIFPGPLPPR